MVVLQVPADIKSAVEAKVAELKEVAAGDDIEAIKKAIEAVQAEAMKMGQAVYQAGQAAEGAAAGPGAPGAEAGDAKKPADDNVVDAEFTDSDK